MVDVRFHGSREELRRLLNGLGGMLSGRGSDPHNFSGSFQSAIGFAALTDIKEAYIEKARGGTDEMGIRWEPLSPKTIANRRVGPGAPPEARERQKIARKASRRAFNRLRQSLPQKEAQRRANIIGGLEAYKQTGKTKVQILGGRDVEILRDTSVLFNSLSPGQLTEDGSYNKPDGEGGEQQIFEAGAGQIIVGTNVKYASTHQNGRGAIPARPFLPTEEHPVPAIWWQRWLGVGVDAFVSILVRVLSR